MTQEEITNQQRNQIDMSERFKGRQRDRQTLAQADT